MTFRDWIAEKVGTRKWVVAYRLYPRLRLDGYELAIPQKKFTALKNEYNETPRS
jgi:hypothetical protein